LNNWLQQTNKRRPDETPRRAGYRCVKVLTPKETARSMFPNIPDELFDLWIAPLVISYDWPFHSIYDSLKNTEWLRIFHPYSLSTISQLKWDLDSFFINKNILCPSSYDDINLIIMNKGFNVFAFIGRDSKPSRDSLAWHKEFIVTTRRLCAPIAAVFTNSGIKIFDGNHRIAALLDLNLYNSIPIDAWIGTPP
jgi:hypothetical protein